LDTTARQRLAKGRDGGGVDARPGQVDLLEALQLLEVGEVLVIDLGVAELQLAKQDTYTLDRAGLSAEEYANQVRAAADRGHPLPTPRVRLTLELRNTGDQAIKILVGSDGSYLMLNLQGPGAVSVRPRTVVSADTATRTSSASRRARATC
jgi:hypothetical protein